MDLYYVWYCIKDSLKGIIRVLGNWIMDSLTMIIQFLGSPGIDSSRKITSSESRDYVGGPGKGPTTSLDLSTGRRLYRKKNSRTDITDIFSQNLMKLLE